VIVGDAPKKEANGLLTYLGGQVAFGRLEAIANAAGQSIPNRDRLLIGDTTSDIAAAAANGCDCIIRVSSPTQVGELLTAIESVKMFVVGDEILPLTEVIRQVNCRVIIVTSFNNIRPMVTTGNLIEYSVRSAPTPDAP